MQVLLKYDGESLCGGVLVDTNWILTAGHCVNKTDVKYMKVVAGKYCWGILANRANKLNILPHYA